MMSQQIQMIKTCLECGEDVTIVVEATDWELWYLGATLVQDTFPYLTADQREILISGICGKCFDKMFPVDIIEV